MLVAAHAAARRASWCSAAEPGFLVFVLALGVVVAGGEPARARDAVDALVPHGTGLPALLGDRRGRRASLANLVNNLPATLIMLPVAAAGGPGAVLAMLVGVNVGPNLTYAGSLATLLWRRVMHAHDEPTDLGEFTRLGALTVPACWSRRPRLVVGSPGALMRAVVWITESSWETCVDEARAPCPGTRR